MTKSTTNESKILFKKQKNYEQDISRVSTEWFVTHTKETFAEWKKILQEETNIVLVEYIDDVCSSGEVVPGARK